MRYSHRQRSVQFSPKSPGFLLALLRKIAVQQRDRWNSIQDRISDTVWYLRAEEGFYIEQANYAMANEIAMLRIEIQYRQDVRSIFGELMAILEPKADTPIM